MKKFQKLIVVAALGAALLGGAAGAVSAADVKEDITMAMTFENVPAEKVLAVKGNPFGLVYDGALTENVPGKVNIHPITYKLLGVDIAANVYTPADYDPAGSYAAVVVAHPNGGVKEQVAGLYAQKLAEAGFIAIAADASYQGASGGTPRHQDIPFFRQNDIRGMVDMISQYPGVDKSRIGALGICGGGGYTLAAVESDARVKAVATLSMFNSGIVRRDGYTVREFNAEAAQKARRQAAEAHQHFVETGETPTTPDMLVTATAEDADKLPMDLYREGWYYYGPNYGHPNSTFSFTVESLRDLIAFDAAQNMALIDQPLLMIAGEKADSLYMSEDAFAKATGTADKELYLVKGATHIQTYWVPEYVKEIGDKLVSFFSAKL